MGMPIISASNDGEVITIEISGLETNKKTFTSKDKATSFLEGVKMGLEAVGLKTIIPIIPDAQIAKSRRVRDPSGGYRDLD